jgi:hypothetical protein
MRKLSSAEYVYRVYKLNIRLGEILINKPQKYKQNYSDQIIKTALSALEHVQTADSIFMSKYTKEEDYLLRKKCLLLAKGEIQHLATASYIFLEIVRKHDYASETVVGIFDRYAKIYDQELEIGEMCEECHKLIVAVLRSDRETYNKYIRPSED